MTRGILDGSWGKSKDEVIGTCSFWSVSNIPATIEITTTGSTVETTVDDSLLFDLKSLKLKSTRASKRATEMHAIDHIDNCQLIYEVSKDDVQFVRDGEDAYISAKLYALPDDETIGVGCDGFVNSHLWLFQVSEEREKDQEKGQGDEPEKRE